MVKSKAFSDSYLVKQRRKEIEENQEYLPPNPVLPQRVNWVKAGILIIVMILVGTVGKRIMGMTEDINKIDFEIEKEARSCLQKFSQINCPINNMEGSQKCQQLYQCARKTKSIEHIRAFLEKAFHIAIFEVSQQVIGPIIVVAIIVALKIIQKFE